MSTGSNHITMDIGTKQLQKSKLTPLLQTMNPNKTPMCKLRLKRSVEIDIYQSCCDGVSMLWDMHAAWHKVQEQVGDVLTTHMRLYLFTVHVLLSADSISSAGRAVCHGDVVGSIPCGYSTFVCTLHGPRDYLGSQAGSIPACIHDLSVIHIQACHVPYDSGTLWVSPANITHMYLLCIMMMRRASCASLTPAIRIFYGSDTRCQLDTRCQYLLPWYLGYLRPSRTFGFEQSGAQHTLLTIPTA